jgi:hypothetical protein
VQGMDTQSVVLSNVLRHWGLYEKKNTYTIRVFSFAVLLEKSTGYVLKIATDVQIPTLTFKKRLIIYVYSVLVRFTKSKPMQSLLQIAPELLKPCTTGTKISWLH